MSPRIGIGKQNIVLQSLAIAEMWSRTVPYCTQHTASDSDHEVSALFYLWAQTRDWHRIILTIAHCLSQWTVSDAKSQKQRLNLNLYYCSRSRRSDARKIQSADEWDISSYCCSSYTL
jgi:hypothetical protein